VTEARPPHGPDATAAEWQAAAGWDAAARLRRQHALAMSPDARLAVVEEMIQLALTAGVFRTKREHAPPPVPRRPAG
jgi:hypothetical protein